MKNYKAFTLLEILITTVLVGFLGIGSIFMVSNSTTVLNRGFKRSMANSNIQKVMKEISRDIKGGTTLSSPTSKELTINYTDSTKTVKWYFESGALYRKDNSNTKKITFQGANSVEVKGTFKTTKPAVYWKTEIDFSIILLDGEELEVGNVNNTYYCRLQTL